MLAFLLSIISIESRIELVLKIFLHLFLSIFLLFIPYSLYNSSSFINTTDYFYFKFFPSFIISLPIIDLISYFNNKENDNFSSSSSKSLTLFKKLTIVNFQFQIVFLYTYNDRKFIICLDNLYIKLYNSFNYILYYKDNLTFNKKDEKKNSEINKNTNEKKKKKFFFLPTFLKPFIKIIKLKIKNFVIDLNDSDLYFELNNFSIKLTSSLLYQDQYESKCINQENEENNLILVKLEKISLLTNNLYLTNSKDLPDIFSLSLLDIKLKKNENNNNMLLFDLSSIMISSLPTTSYILNKYITLLGSTKIVFADALNKAHVKAFQDLLFNINNINELKNNSASNIANNINNNNAKNSNDLSKKLFDIHFNINSIRIVLSEISEDSFETLEVTNLNIIHQELIKKSSVSISSIYTKKYSLSLLKENISKIQLHNPLIEFIYYFHNENQDRILSESSQLYKTLIGKIMPLQISITDHSLYNLMLVLKEIKYILKIFKIKSGRDLNLYDEYLLESEKNENTINNFTTPTTTSSSISIAPHSFSSSINEVLWKDIDIKIFSLKLSFLTQTMEQDEDLELKLKDNNEELLVYSTNNHQVDININNFSTKLIKKEIHNELLWYLDEVSIDFNTNDFYNKLNLVPLYDMEQKSIYIQDLSGKIQLDSGSTNSKVNTGYLSFSLSSFYDFFYYNYNLLLNNIFNSNNNINLILINIKNIFIQLKNNDLYLLGKILSSLSSPVTPFLTNKRFTSSFILNYFNISPKILLKKLSKLNLNIESITLNLFSFSINSNNQEVVNIFSILDNHPISVTTEKYNLLMSKLFVSIDKDIIIKTTNLNLTQNATYSTHTICKISREKKVIQSTNEESKTIVYLPISFSTYKSFGELFQLSNSFYSFGYYSSHTLIQFHSLTYQVDIIDLTALIQPINLISYAKTVPYYNIRKSNPKFIDPLEFNMPLTSIPTSVFNLSIKALKLSFSLNYKLIFMVFLKNLSFSLVNFANYIKQTIIEGNSFQISEVTLDKTVHKNVFENIYDESDPQNRSSQLKVVISSKKNENSIMEFYLKYLRIFYMHRATFTVWNYIKAPLIPSINSIFSYKKRDKSNPFLLFKPLGLFRFCLFAEFCEAHVPVNSYSNEGLAVVFNQVHLFFENDLVKSDQKYCQGPFIADRTVLSEINNIKLLNEFIFSSPSTSASSSNIYSLISKAKNDINWNLIKNKEKLVCSCSSSPVWKWSQVRWHIDVYDASISSWCSPSLPICRGQNVNILLTLRQTDKVSSEGVYRYVFDDEPADNNTFDYYFAMDEDKSRIETYITSSLLDWTITQGQYWAIVKLIQQNIPEQVAIVPEPNPLPPPKKCDLSDDLFGKYSINLNLGVLNTTPIAVKEGRIIGLLNDDEYYVNIVTPVKVPAMSLFEICNENFIHNPYLIVPSSLHPSLGIHNLREQTFSHWINSPNTPIKHRHSNPPISPFNIIFEDLFVDFFRTHYNGGSGIEAWAETLTLLSDKTVNEFNREKQNSLLGASSFVSHFNVHNIKEVNERHILLTSKKALSQLSGSAQISADEYNDFLSNFPSGEVERTFDYSTSRPEKNKHLVYKQQGVNNLRRCLVNLSHSVLVCHLPPLIAVADFFLAPIRINGMRDQALLQDLGISQLDTRGTIDVEVKLESTTLSLPNFLNSEEASASSSSSSTNNKKGISDNSELKGKSSGLTSSSNTSSSINDSAFDNSMNCVNFDLDVTYTHAFRGFQQSGPGRDKLFLEASVLSNFISPLRDIYMTNLMKPLVDPVLIVFKSDKTAVSSAIMKERNLAAIGNTIRFGEWVHRPNRFERTSGSRMMELNIMPTSYLKLIEKKNERLNIEKKSIDSEDDYETDHHEEEDDYCDFKETKSRSLRPNDPVCRGSCSFKDIQFIFSSIKQLKTSLADYFSLPFLSHHSSLWATVPKYIEDIKNINNITYTTVYTHFSQQVYEIEQLKKQNLDYSHINLTFPKIDVKELKGQICNFEFTIRNNTYGLNLLRLDLDNICLDYYRSPQQLHLNAGVRVALWTYNDKLDDWEPLIEPIAMRSIGATDSTYGDQVGLTLATRIKIDVTTDALEINASQYSITNFLKKWALADVITTSSRTLPPYQLINDLGIDVPFNVEYFERPLLRERIKATEIFPIKTTQLNLESKNNSSLHKHLRNNLGEYLLRLAVNNNGKFYKSSSISMDKVGIQQFEMLPISLKHNNSIGSYTKLFDLTRIEDKKFFDSLPNDEISEKNEKNSELPLIFLDMRIKSDSVRELRLKSILSFRNTTSYIFQLKIKYNKQEIEYNLYPSCEWFVPVYLAHPKATLYCRFLSNDDKNKQEKKWLEIVPMLGQLISQGYWGGPQRLKANYFILPEEKLNSSKSDLSVILLRPEALFSKSSLSENKKVRVPVRYPSSVKQNLPCQAPSQNYQSVLSNGGFLLSDSSVDTDDFSLFTNTGSNMKIKSRNVNPFCVYLQAPLQISNFLPVPMMYRIADMDGYISASGTILPSQLLDLFNLPFLFSKRYFISIRIINYSWSKWVRILNRSGPFSNQEKNVEILLNSLYFTEDEKISTPFSLPPLDINMIMKEFIIKFTCQTIISNHTGSELLCTSNNSISSSSSSSSSTFIQNCFIPLSSGYSVKDYLQNDFKSLQFKFKNNYFNQNLDDEELDLEGEEEITSVSPTILGLDFSPVEASNLVTILVHLPQDHSKVVKIEVPGNKALSSIFSFISSHISYANSHIEEENYYIYLWKYSKSLAMVSKEIEKDNIDETIIIPNNPSSTPSQTNSIGKLEKKKSADSTFSSSSSAIPKSTDIPNNLKYDMELELETQLSKSATIEKILLNNNVKELEIVLVHSAELDIFKQSSQYVVKSMNELNEKDSSTSSMISKIFSKNKFVFLTKFIQIFGSFPFKPQRMLGLNPHLNIKVLGETDWSSGVDIIKGDFDKSEFIISLPSIIDSSNDHMPRDWTDNRILFEFGLSIDRGSSLFQNSSIVSIIPKHIFVSKLNFHLEIRQIESSNGGLLIPLTLAAKTVRNFHFQNLSKNRTLQIRKGSYLDPNDENNKFEIDPIWRGEIDICKIGVIYVRMKNPLMIIKVETEIVGASYITTFSESNALWPPYRIVNNTSLPIKYKQIHSNDNVSLEKNSSITSTLLNSTNNDLNLSSLLSFNNSSSSTQIINPNLDYDILDINTTCPYTWDYPLTGDKVLLLEFPQGNSFVQSTIILDKELKKDHIINLKTQVPNLGNPLAEGILNIRGENLYLSSDSKAISWTHVYCILRPDLLYIYKDESRNHLLTVINLSIPSSFAIEGRKYGGILRQMNKSWDYNNNKSIIHSILNTNSSSNDNFLDVNLARKLILIISNHIGLLSNGNTLPARSTTKKSKLSNSLEDLKSYLISGLGIDQLLAQSSSTRIKIKEIYRAIIELKLNAQLRYRDNKDEFNREEESIELILSFLIQKYILLIKENSLIDENTPTLHLYDKNNELTNQDFSDESDDDIEDNFDNSSLINDVTYKKYYFSYTDLKKYRKNRSLFLQELGELCVFFNPPSLNPELMAASNRENSFYRQSKLEKRKSTTSNLFKFNSEEDNSSHKQDEDNEEFLGFSFIINSLKIHIKFEQEPEFIGWIQAFRLSLESSWVNYLTGKKPKNSFIFNSDYQKNIFLTLKNDGATKVLLLNEFIPSKEIDSIINTKEEIKNNQSYDDYYDFYNGGLITSSNNSNFLSKSAAKVLKITRVSNILPILGGNKRKSLKQNQTSPSPSAYLVNANKNNTGTDQQLVNVTFTVESVSLSLIDDTPTEVVYLRLHSINMNVVRYIDRVQFACAVREIQLNDQLMKANFPVMLTKRVFLSENSSDKKKINLPGLDSSFNSSFYYGDNPMLYLYFQQRYHNIEDVQTTTPSNSESSNSKLIEQEDSLVLWYFDTLTLWLSPLHIGLDEEVSVRLMRFIYSMKKSLPKSRNPNKKKSKKSSINNNNNLMDFFYLEKSKKIKHLLINSLYSQHIEAGMKQYIDFRDTPKTVLNLYFGHLKIFPIDITLNFRTSPETQLSNAELAIISIISQLDGYRLCLNALQGQNVFGSRFLISEVLMKHYRTSFWRQFHRLIGASTSEEIDSSVGLVANLGGGVYDLQYQDEFNRNYDDDNGGAGGDNIDNSLISVDEQGNQVLSTSPSQSSKVSLASRAIGSTSAIAGKIAGGIGKGVSLLTLDSDFQRNRSHRRFVKTTSVSEGLMVGTQELGKNIVEGVAGIVYSPYRGWETGGSVGAAVGVAKGLLGVALKPAVGVIDLATRATEGIKNTAYSLSVNEVLAGIEILVKHENRSRYPRVLSSDGLVEIYNRDRSFIQFIIDFLINFRPELRIQWSHFIKINRVVYGYNPNFISNTHSPPSSPVSSHKSELNILPLTPQQDFELIKCNEQHGLKHGNKYISLICSDKILLLEISSYSYSFIVSSSTSSINDCISNDYFSNNPKKILPSTSCSSSLIWSIPATCLENCQSDSNGDIIIITKQPISYHMNLASSSLSTLSSNLMSSTGSSSSSASSNTVNNNINLLFDSNQAVIFDLNYQNYVIFQRFLETFMSPDIARRHPLTPHAGLTMKNIKKSYPSSIKSMFFSPTTHTYRFYGHVMYEFTSTKKDKSSESTSDLTSNSTVHYEDNEDFFSQHDYNDDLDLSNSNSTSNLSSFSPIHFNDPLDCMYLSYIYPLINMIVKSPIKDESTKLYKVMLIPYNTKKLQILRREDNDILTEVSKSSIYFFFPTIESANDFKTAMKKRILIINNQNSSVSTSNSASAGGGSSNPSRRDESSINNRIVIPTTGCDTRETEEIKIAIADICRVFNSN